MSKRTIYVVQETHDDPPELIDWYLDERNRDASANYLKNSPLSYVTWQFEYEGPMNNIQLAIRSQMAARAKREGESVKVEPITNPPEHSVFNNKPYHLKCTECGGTDLTFDATVHWSPTKQGYVLNERVEGVSPYCPDCDDYTDDELVFDETIKTVKPFDIPERVGLFHTPANMGEMQAHLNNHHAGDAGIANTCAFMMFNLMVKGMHEQKDYYETIFEEITGESRPWGAEDEE